MKLLKSWISYKSQRHLPRCLKIAGRTPNIFLIGGALSVVIMLLLAACEEKIPTIQNLDDLFERRTLTIPADSMRYAQGVVQPGIGNSTLLYVGDDENVHAYTLMKFGDVGYFLPDSIDRFLTARLILTAAKQYRLNDLPFPDMTINVDQLMNEGVDPWTEDSSHVRNFHIADYGLDRKTVFTYSAADTDTVSIPLDPALVSGWYDESIDDYTLVFQQADTTVAAVQAFYSSEASDYPRIGVTYVVADDTLKSDILPTADLSIIRFKQSLSPATRFSISSGRAGFCLLKFNFENLLPDENAVIARADLKLKIDPAQTYNYGELFNLYINVVDSNIVMQDSLDESGNPVLIPGYDPAQESYTYSASVAATGDSVIISIKSLIQGVISGYSANYGIVLYTLPSFSNIASLSLYNASDQNLEQYRPRIQILQMKER
ncbi:MAG: hypothetical protein ACP5FZ_04430 [Fidelibacterota bacterium]